MDSRGRTNRNRIEKALDAGPISYDEAIIKTIQTNWCRLLAEHHHPERGKIVIQFQLQSDGTVRNIRAIENEVGDELKQLCQKAVQAGAPYPEWPFDLRRQLGKGSREVQFTFYVNENSTPAERPGGIPASGRTPVAGGAAIALDDMVEAAARADRTHVAAALSARIGINGSHSKTGRTALTAAAEHGHHEVVACLLEKGADVNLPDRNRWTALMLAAYHGFAEVVEALLAQGANPNVSHADTQATALISASQNGNPAVVRRLLEAGAEVNARMRGGGTALMCAAEKGHREVVDLLLARGADLRALSSNDVNALMLASQHGHRDVIERLLAQGAPLNVQAKDGRTALMVACQFRHPEIAQQFCPELIASIE
jgi:uncharacterized protein